MHVLVSRAIDLKSGFALRGKYGWIRPTVPVEHLQAARRQGLVYVSMSDLQGGLEALTVGSLCQFHLYSDASGLGGEEVIGS